MNLEIYKDDIRKIITAVSNSCIIEIAVFDEQCNLISSTKNYTEKKGKSVHIPALLDVLTTGNILVNKPGHMQSCIGCRFQNNCPATIEILNTLTINNKSIGIIAFTSFTEEGHELLTNNLDSYVDLLHEVSFMLSSMILYQTQSYDVTLSNKVLLDVMSISKDSFLLIDQTGAIEFYNEEAQKLFPLCSLGSQSLPQLIPKLYIDEVLTGKAIKEKQIRIDTMLVTLSSIPITKNGEFAGAALNIKQEANVKIAKKQVAPLMHGKQFLDDIKTSSICMTDIKEKVEKISKNTSSVLICGETGTGKELFAKAIHYNSPRASSPFVSINCASIPESLFESELFGYEEGAFTGAKRGGKIGKFELAQGGTLLLDEIGEMPIYMQAKLLRVLQEFSIERIGGTHCIPVDIRIIAATNQNLEAMIADGKFRIDLFYRLNVISLFIPPLRERPDDLEPLAMHFLNKYNLKMHKNIKTFNPKALSILLSYDWPGNVRELENALEYAVNIEESTVITPNSLPDILSKRIDIPGIQMKENVKNVEFSVITTALNKHGWDLKGKKEAAKELRIGLRTLYRKLESMEPLPNHK